MKHSQREERLRAAAAEFILEGLYAHKRIGRNEEQEFTGGERVVRDDRMREEPGEEGFRRDNPGFRRGRGGGQRNLN